VIRAAVAGEAEGFGITAYLSAGSADPAEAAAALSAAMDAFADALAAVASPAPGGSKLQ
jgi:hypothetical protein